MGEAYIFDAVRTPRGRGKKTGSLHTVKAVDLMGAALRGIQTRNELNTAVLDDVTVGCVTQVGEQGACIARTAVLEARIRRISTGCDTEPFLWFRLRSG